MIRFAPSLLSANFSKLGEELLKLEAAGVDAVHIDVMDGMFVPNITLGVPVIQRLREVSGLMFDVHLMIQNPGCYTDAFIDAGADIVTIHAEACTHLNRDIQRIKDRGVKAGVALNPATPLDVVEWVLEEVDLVLLMTVNPGFGGQAFIPSSLRKIAQLSELVRKRGLQTDIQVDGGIDLQNVGDVVAAGANFIVSGSAFFKAPSMKEFVKTIKAF